MTEIEKMTKPINLHTISALQEIKLSDGVKLRPLIQSDDARILEVLKADSSIRDRVSVASRLHTVKDITKEIEQYRKDAGLIRYVLLKEDNPIGLVSLWRDDGLFGEPPHLDDYGFGYFLDPNERGKGLTTRAVQSLMDAVVENLKVNQFVAFCEDNNKESVSVLLRLGFEPTDTLFPEPDNGWMERKYIKKL